MKKLFFLLVLLALPLASRATSYVATNDLAQPFNCTFFLNTNSAYVLGTNAVLATNGTVTLTQAGTNWLGVALQNTNGGLMVGSYFTNCGTTGGKFSLVLSNSFTLPYPVTPFLTNSPGNLTPAGLWTNSNH